MIYIAALTKTKEFEIRMRYELGEDLNKLSIIYKVPLSTIKKRKKIAELNGDMWIKGSRSKEAYKMFTDEDTYRKKEIAEKIKATARAELEELQGMIDTTYATATQFDDEIEAIVYKRSSRIEKFLDLKRKIEDIPSLKEEAEIEKLKLEIELRKLEAEDKALSLKERKEELELLLGGK